MYGSVFIVQMLAASRELHKFFHDCKDVLGRILEKQHSMSDELGRDAGSVSALQRKHQNFLQDLLTLQSQVSTTQFRMGTADFISRIMKLILECRFSWPALIG